jgi:hypothetical protein
MTKRILTLLLGLPGLLLVAGLTARAQDKDKAPEWKHALELRVRKAGEEDFTKDTKKYGVEVYVDPNGSAGVHISETGSVAVIPGKLFKPAEGKLKDPLWRHGLALAARKAGEKEFTKETKKYGLEVYRDENNGNLIYISEGGNLDTVAAKFAEPTVGKPKNPTWKHAMDLKVRKAGEKDFTKDTKKFGVEVFKDENNGNWVYVTETGAFAVVPGKLAGDATGKNPAWKHGMELAVRKAGEKEFTKDTKRFGIEVFLDENNGNLIYIGETGEIAVVPGKLARPTPTPAKGPDWKRAMELSARKAGEAEFTKATKRYGVEVYGDENNGNLIYISETGDLSVLPGKEE